MTMTRRASVLQLVRGILAGRRLRTAPDKELLERFLDAHDEAAFEEIVHRHGPLVLDVCRGVLANDADAEDAFQATFLVLAHRAGAIRRTASLASWLHGVACRTALKARAGAVRRRQHEAEVPQRQVGDQDSVTWTEARQVLHEELGRLSDRHRQPLVLCYLLGKTQDKAAQLLGLSKGTLKRRLERGRAVLRQRLVRRGLGSAALLVASAWPTATARALVPQSLFLATIKAAMNGAAGGAATPAVSASVAASTVGVLKNMLLTRRLIAILPIVLLLGGLLAVASTGAFRPGDDTRARISPREEGSPTNDPMPVPPATAGRIRIVVLDPRGKPLPGAEIHVSVWTDEKDFKAKHDCVTDAEGAVQVELPKTFSILRLWAGKKPFVRFIAGWEKAELASGKGVPPEYTFRLETAGTAGGRVLDDNGKPIVGARVLVRLANDPKPARSDGRTRYDHSLAWGSDAATTDVDGRWRIDNVPDHSGAELSFLVSHPDYVNDDRWSGSDRRGSGVTMAMLREGTAVLTMKRGIIVRGLVTDPDGQPVKDALVIHGDEPYFPTTTCTFPTDAGGGYRLPALAPGTTSLTVLAPGFAPQLRKVDLRTDLPPQDFHLRPGKPVGLRIVDGVGKPVPRASVALREWQGSKSITSDHNPNHPKIPDTGIPHRADENGVWTWSSAPDDPVKVEVSAKGFAPVKLEITGGTDRIVTLKAEHQVTGRVTDAATGKPVPSFTVIPLEVSRKDFPIAVRRNGSVGKDGQLTFLATRTEFPLRLRVEAPVTAPRTGPSSGSETMRSGDRTSAFGRARH